MRNQIATLFFLVLIGLFAASCGGARGGPLLYSLPPSTLPFDNSRDLYEPIGGYPTQYYPYVEEIQIPEPIVDNQPFTITFYISAEFRPAILRGYQYANMYGKWTSGVDLDEFLLDIDIMDRQGNIHEDVVLARTIVTNPVAEGLPVSTLCFHFPGLPAGIYEMQYFTVDDRQYGGVGGAGSEWGLQGDPELVHVLPVFTTFEVIPAEGAE